MDIFKIIGFGFVATVLAIVLKGYKPEFALSISVLSAVAIFFFIAPYLVSVLNMFFDIAGKVNIDAGYITIVLRIIGVAYVTEFGAQLCRDAGEGAIASKMEFAGKIAVLAMGMPVLYGLVNLITKLV